jgi:hypothetical protein
VSITDEKIKSFITDVPSLNRTFVKGTYDWILNVGYWLYNDDADLDTATDSYRYNKALVLNGLSLTFYPWEIGESVPVIRGLLFVTDGSRALEPVVKLTTTVPIDDSTEYLTYSGCFNDSYLDWTNWAGGVDGDAADEIDYDSYFITGMRLDGGGIKFFQPNHVHVFCNPISEGSCFMQGLFDWANDEASGKWSSAQQIYNANMLLRSINFRRLKVRGKGRALQLKFYSESGKPFEIIGWGLRESANADI